MFSDLFEKIKTSNIRLFIVFALICSIFAFVLVKLFMIQVVKDNSSTIADLEKIEETLALEEGHSTVSVPVCAPRGEIYDKNGKLLAYNEIQYNLEFFNSASFENNEERNEAIYQLILLLREYNLESNVDFPLIVNDEGKLEYTISENSLYRFLKNCFGLISVNDLSDEQKLTTPDELFDYLCNGNEITSMFGISDKYSLEDAVEICAYRYLLYTNNPSYKSIRIISDISEDFRIIAMERQNVIPCIYVSKSYKRIYNDSIYFAHIIGYIGLINDTELNSYLEEGLTNYNSESYVGKLGVEKSYDTFLQGQVGTEQVEINKRGQVVSRKTISEPVDGNNLYLSIDSDMQIAGYNIVKSNVAAIFLGALVNSQSYGSKGQSADDITVPVYEVYNAFISNNLIDIDRLETEERTDAEERVYSTFSTNKVSILSRINDILAIDNKTAYKEYSVYNKNYLDYLYSKLKGDWNIISINVDTDEEYFQTYIKGNCSLPELILACIENGNINTSALGLEVGYYDTTEIYNAIIDYIFIKLDDDNSFDKLIYQNLIFSLDISGRDLCLILFDQGYLKEDLDSYNSLTAGTLSAYDFVKRKINNLEIEPAALALQPCSGSLVVTDPNSGDVLAMVSYPSYDNNRLTNSIDYDYYTKLSNDKSYPMLCRATQSKTTTGSAWKPLTSVLALTEGFITTETTIHDNVKFDKIEPPPSCWQKYGHGNLNVTNAIRDSCNYFFFTVAYNFSTNSRGDYSDEQGLNLIHKYGAKFGFDSLSGVEITESMPEMSTTDAVRTSIGYYHSFAPIHIARYATTIANSGTCYNLTLIDHVETKSGTVVFEKENSVYNELSEVSQGTWDAVHLGMKRVVDNISSFRGVGTTVAGKTGTAQVSLNQPNNAVFISYAPYTNPELSVTCVLPNGYKSANAAKVASEFYAFHYKGTNKENLLSGNVFAGEADENNVGD